MVNDDLDVQCVSILFLIMNLLYFQDCSITRESIKSHCFYVTVKKIETK